jgi:hypothetical protein
MKLLFFCWYRSWEALLADNPMLSMALDTQLVHFKSLPALERRPESQIIEAG